MITREKLYKNYFSCNVIDKKHENRYVQEIIYFGTKKTCTKNKIFFPKNPTQRLKNFLTLSGYSYEEFSRTLPEFSHTFKYLIISQSCKKPLLQFI